MNQKIKRPLLFSIIGAIIMLNFLGCFGNLKYKAYSSRDPQINLNMDYPATWSFREDRGALNSYAQVVFFEKNKKNKTFMAAIVVTVQQIDKANLALPTLQGMKDDLINKRMHFKDCKVLSESKIKLLESDALDIALSYRTMDKLSGIDAKLIPVKERIIILQKDGRFYTIRYENTAEEFDQFDKAFYRCIKTLKFKS